MLDCGRASDGRWLRYHDAMVEINERKKGDGGDPESADRPHGDNIVMAADSVLGSFCLTNKNLYVYVLQAIVSYLDGKF